MAMNMAFLYPESIDGVVIHSGLGFKIAQDVIYANEILMNPPLELAGFQVREFDHIKKWMLIHGKKDLRVHFDHMGLIKKQILSSLNNNQLINNQVSILDYSIDELAHKWSGGANRDYSDPSAPDVTSLILEIFLN